MTRQRVRKLKAAGIVLPVCLMTAGLIGLPQCGTRRGDSTETVRGAITMPPRNVALQTAGAVAEASSTHSSGFAPAGAINGDRKGANWGNNAGWNDGTADTFPDSFKVTFAGASTIDEIDVFSLQDNYGNPSEPTATMTFSQYGLRDFDVQYWESSTSAWVTVPGGSITGNNLVWRRITFPPVTTSQIQIRVNNALNTWSRIVEVEAYGAMSENAMAWWKLACPGGCPSGYGGPSVAAAIAPGSRGTEIFVGTPGLLSGVATFRTRSNIERAFAGFAGASPSSDTTAISVASADGGTTMDVFWVMADKTVTTRSWSGGVFGNPVALPYGQLVGGVGAGGKTNRVDVVGVGTDHNLYQAYRIGGSWTGWVNMPALAGGFAAVQPAVVWTPDAIWVFAVASDGTVQYTRNPNSYTWDQWKSLGPVSAQSGLAATIVGNRIDLFVAAGSGIVQRTSTDAGTTWVPSNGWSPVGPAISVMSATIDGTSRKVAPTAIARAAGVIDLFVRDTNGDIQLMTIRPQVALSGANERGIVTSTGCGVSGGGFGEIAAASTICSNGAGGGGGSSPYEFLSYGWYGILRVPESDFFAEQAPPLSSCPLQSGPGSILSSQPFEIRFPGDGRRMQTGGLDLPPAPNLQNPNSIVTADNQIVRLSDNSLISLRHVLLCATGACTTQSPATAGCPSSRIQVGADLIYRFPSEGCGLSPPTWNLQGKIDPCDSDKFTYSGSDRPEMAAKGMHLFVAERSMFNVGTPMNPIWEERAVLWKSIDQGASWTEWVNDSSGRRPDRGLTEITTVGDHVVMFSPGTPSTHTSIWAKSTENRWQNPIETPLPWDDFSFFMFPGETENYQSTLSVALASSSPDGDYARVAYTTMSGGTQRIKTGLVRINSNEQATVLTNTFVPVTATDPTQGSILFPTLIEADRVSGPANGGDQPPVVLFWVETTSTDNASTVGCFSYLNNSNYCNWGKISIKATVFRGQRSPPSTRYRPRIRQPGRQTATTCTARRGTRPLPIGSFCTGSTRTPPRTGW